MTAKHTVCGKTVSTPRSGAVTDYVNAPAKLAGGNAQGHAPVSMTSSHICSHERNKSRVERAISIYSVPGSSCVVSEVHGRSILPDRLREGLHAAP